MTAKMRITGTGMNQRKGSVLMMRNSPINRSYRMLPACVAAVILCLDFSFPAHAAQPLDWRGYEASDEYIVKITGASSRQESFLDFKDEDSGVYMGSGLVMYHLLDAGTKEEIASQQLFYKMEDTKGMLQILPEGASYPYIYVTSDEERNKKHTADHWGEAEASCTYYDPLIRKDGTESPTEHSQNYCNWRLNYTGGLRYYFYDLLQDKEEDIISRTAAELLREIPDDMYSDAGRGGKIYRDVHGEDYETDDGRVIGRYAWHAEEGYSAFSETDDHVEIFEARYAAYRQLPEVPFILFECEATYYGQMTRVKTRTERMRQRKEPDELAEQYRILKMRIENEFVEAVATMPIVTAWQEPVWTDAQAGSSAAAETDEAEESYAMNVPWEGIVKPSAAEDDEAEETADAEAGTSGEWPGNLSETGSAPYFDQDAWGEDHPEAWEQHADTFDTVWRSFLQWLAALLLGGGIGSTVGGGAGSALGGAVGGFPGGPGDGTSGDETAGDGTSGDAAEGSADEDAESQRRPWSWEDPSSLPDGWKIDREGALRFRDPVTGERMKYELTGYNEKTGEPQYIDKRGSYLTESMIRDMYDFRERNAHNVALDESTGKRWAEEQHDQNQAKWDEERATGVTEDSRWWSDFKEEQQREQKREEYMDRLAAQYGKDSDDINGIKKEILKDRTKAGIEYERQMEKDAWLEFGEKTASQVESVADVAVNTLGEVTGPPGKIIKNAYTFAKPGLSKLSESIAEGKDVYDTMTAIAQGTAEGAIGVLQNEVDGFGMAVGGDVLKTGLDGIVQGKSAEEIKRDMEKTALESGMNYGIGQIVSGTGKKISDKITAPKTQKVGKTLDSFDKMGADGWKNMLGNKEASTLAKQKIAYYKTATKNIQNMENWTKAGTNLFDEVFKRKVTGEATSILAETGAAYRQMADKEMERAAQVIDKVTGGKLRNPQSKVVDSIRK